MPSTSKSQQRLFGMVHAYQKGKLKHAPAKVREIAEHISDEDAKHFAKTRHDGLPERKNGKEDEDMRKSAAYTAGFMSKCAEYGVDAETSGKLMKAAAHWSAHLVPWTTKSERQDQLANAAYYSQRAQGMADYFGRGDQTGKNVARSLLHSSNASLLGGKNTKAFKRYMELQQPHIRAEQEAYYASHPDPSPVQTKPVEKAPTAATTDAVPVQPPRRVSGGSVSWNPYAARYRGIDRLMDDLANNRRL